MHIDTEEYFPARQVKRMRALSWRWGVLAGFWLGLLFAALLDIADVWICIGACDGQKLTLLN